MKDTVKALISKYETEAINIQTKEIQAKKIGKTVMADVHNIEVSHIVEFIHDLKTLL